MAHRMQGDERAFLTLMILIESCAEPPLSQEGVEWAGHRFQEVRTIKELPANIQTVLGVGKSGLDGIADRKGKYNPTDVVDSTLPTRRFLVAGVDGDAAFVAIEHGGLGWGLDVILFDHADQKATTVLFESPQTLRALVERLGTAVKSSN